MGKSRRQGWSPGPLGEGKDMHLGLQVRACKPLLKHLWTLEANTLI